MPSPSYLGIIKDTKPKPVIYFGSITGIGKYLGVSYSTAHKLCNEPGYKPRGGWRRMTSEEEIKYYRPPPPGSNNLPDKLKLRQYWKITMRKRGNKSESSGEFEDIFSGSIEDFKLYIGLDRTSQIHKVLDAHLGQSKGAPVYSVRGWKPFRIRQYKEAYKRRSRMQIREDNRKKGKKRT